MNCLTVIHKQRTYNIYPCNIIYCKRNPTNLLIKVAIFVNSASKHLNNPKLCGTLSIVNSVCKTLNTYQYLHECSQCIYFCNTSGLMFFLGFPSALLSGGFPFLALLKSTSSSLIKLFISAIFPLHNGLFQILHWFVFPKPLFSVEFTKIYHMESGLNSTTTMQLYPLDLMMNIDAFSLYFPAVG